MCLCSVSIFIVVLLAMVLASNRSDRLSTILFIIMLHLLTQTAIVSLFYRIIIFDEAVY